jgi:hypothetical protein
MKKFILAALVLAPSLALAQTGNLNNIQRLLESIGNLVELALPIVVGLALLGFFWGLVKFIFAKGNDDDKKDAKNTMVWSVVALFVMVSVWGLVKFIGDAVGVKQGEKVIIPTVPNL